MVRRWVSGLVATLEHPAETRERAWSSRERELLEVLNHLKGLDSRRLVRELAEAAIKGDAVPFDAALRSRYRKPNGTAFAGMVAGTDQVDATDCPSRPDHARRGNWRLPHRPGRCRDHPGALVIVET